MCSDKVESPEQQSVITSAAADNDGQMGRHHGNAEPLKRTYGGLILVLSRQGRERLQCDAVAAVPKRPCSYSNILACGIVATGNDWVRFAKIHWLCTFWSCTYIVKHWPSPSRDFPRQGEHVGSETRSCPFSEQQRRCWNADVICFRLAGKRRRGCDTDDAIENLGAHRTGFHITHDDTATTRTGVQSHEGLEPGRFSIGAHTPGTTHD